MGFDIVLHPSKVVYHCNTINETIQKVSELLYTMPPETRMEIFNLQTFDSDVDRMIAMGTFSTVKP